MYQLSERDKSARNMLKDLRQSGRLIPSFSLLGSVENLSEHVLLLQSYREKHFAEVNSDAHSSMSSDLSQFEFDSAHTTIRTTAHSTLQSFVDLGKDVLYIEYQQLILQGFVEIT